MSLKRPHSPENDAKENKKKKSVLSEKNKETKEKSLNFVWSVESLLAEKENLAVEVAQETAKLLNNDASVPFISRYRKHLTGSLDAEKLHAVKKTLDDISVFKRKCEKTWTALEKNGISSPALQSAIENCKCNEELEHIMIPFENITKKKTLFQRAKDLGFEDCATKLLKNEIECNLEMFVQTNGPKELSSVTEIRKGLISVLVHKIIQDKEILDFIRDKEKVSRLTLEVKLNRTAKKENNPNLHKFERFIDKNIFIENINPSEILAINRGEKLKCLSVSANIPQVLYFEFRTFVFCKMLESPKVCYKLNKLLDDACISAFKNVKNLITRKMKTTLKTIAEKASIEVFASNLKRLLLQKPVKNKVILAIDPGFKNGCKVAVISPNGNVLATCTINPHLGYNSQSAANTLIQLCKTHNCTTIALGNGKACRQTEKWLNDIISANLFKPLVVNYTIINERGASHYSVSQEAKKELADYNDLEIGAITLARRLQDPLGELIKVNPKNLGIGMYQHDLKDKLLQNTLDEVISDCVSNVGVDLNTASQCLLRRIAGLTEKRAENIVQYRIKNGPFLNRNQLKQVTGIGEKVFEQCSGFTRILPSDLKNSEQFYNNPNTNPLDTTWIHPESYDLATKILNKFHLNPKQIGCSSFIEAFQKCILTTTVKCLVKEFKSNIDTIQLIVDGLSHPFNFDIRDESTNEPLFRSAITNFADLKVGLILTGCVTNVTHFGAFIDIGVERDGLIHNKFMNNVTLELGHRVEVKIIFIDEEKSKIHLNLIKVL